MNSTSQIQVSAFYCFKTMPLEAAEAMKTRLEKLGAAEDFRGLILLGTEGINGTVSGPIKILDRAKDMIREYLDSPDQVFKDSFAANHPFHELKVKIKEEIVTLRRPDLVPNGPNHHLSPAEWDQMLDREDVVVLDTRNNYETKMGRFEKAIDFNITDFHDFPERLKDANIPKDKNVMIYCTGGIRCEKAILEMHEQGYQNVYQLDGGILNYLKEYPDKKFEGDCFVFDYRVAVDQNLSPSPKYRLCPHCGQPAHTKIECAKCGTESLVCEECLEISADKKTCSKNCAHHMRINSKSKKPQTCGLKNRPPQ